MDKYLSAAIVCLLLCGCSVSQKTEVSKFTVDMNVVRTNRPDLYERFMDGEIVIDDVYLDKTSTIRYHGVDYHIVSYEPASTVK